MLKLVVVLDGSVIKLNPPDLDGDGITGGVEVLNSPINNIALPVVNPNDTAEALKELNKDELEPRTKMSSIDSKCRLNIFETNGILVWDTLVKWGVLPLELLDFTRQKKRLSNSLDGKGRGEFVSIFTGQREHQEKSITGWGDRFKNLVGLPAKDEQKRES